MDFVDWCEKVLRGVVDVTRASPNSRLIGVNEDDVANHLFGAGRAEDPEFYESDLRMGILDALGDLKNASLITEGGGQYKPTPLGVEVSSEPAHYWKGVCEVKLDAEHEQLLRVVNKLSVDAHEDYVRTNEVENDRLLPELKWSDAEDLLWVISEELEGRGLLNRQAFMGGHVELTANYNGLVWETRRHLLRKCDVFISHATDEREAALALKEFLKTVFGEDLKVFVSSDYRSIRGGKKWFDELTEALRTAPVILTLLSGNSVGRRWINFESGIGYGAGGLIIPLTIAGFAKKEVGLPLSILQARTLQDREDVRGVVEDVEERLQRSAGKVDVDPFTASMAGFTVAAPETPFPIDIHLEPILTFEADEAEEYRLNISLENVGPAVINDYIVEVEFPIAFASTNSALEVPERKTATHRYFRLTEKDGGNKPLYSGDKRLVLSLAYSIDYFKVRDVRTDEKMRELVTVTVRTGELTPRVIRKEMLEIVKVPEF